MSNTVSEVDRLLRDQKAAVTDVEATLPMIKRLLEERKQIAIKKRETPEAYEALHKQFSELITLYNQQLIQILHLYI